MILALDDDPVQLELLRKALESGGFSVETFGRGRDALDRLAAVEPELIVSDVVMPEMDGLAFREAYQARYPHRQTPFVFLTSLGDPASVVRGLDAGADDYLTKPIAPEVLQAKARSLLARKARYASPVFQGDLGRFPFIKVLQFCESSGLTGQVDFSGPGLETSVPFRAGTLALDDTDALGALYDLAEGRFTIRALPADLRGLEALALAPEPRQAPAAASDRPMGRLSGVRAGQRLFQVQTELATYPERQVLSVVILDGNTVLKRRQPAPAGADRAALERLIETQHVAVEQEIRDRLASLAQGGSRPEARPEEPSAAPQPTAKERYYQLFEAGLEDFRQRRYAEAVARWEEARTLNPTDRLLETNIRVARSKLVGR